MVVEAEIAGVVEHEGVLVVGAQLLCVLERRGDAGVVGGRVGDVLAAERQRVRIPLLLQHRYDIIYILELLVIIGSTVCHNDCYE